MRNAEKIELYQCLFRGRTDVYPRRWEKGEKSGWSPAYDIDWSSYRIHKEQGGSMKDFADKKLCPSTDAVVLNHLMGKETIGIYPILSDNTSYFIAVDFDEGDFKNDCGKFITVCGGVGLLSYAELSRSGKGAHAWIFFENAYPCWKSRAMILELLRQALGMSIFEKESSFDRLFPNQDVLPEGGFGNLIGLPLSGSCVSKGTTVFCNEHWMVYENQWDFLKTIHTHSIVELDSVYEKVILTEVVAQKVSHVSSGDVLRIIDDGSLHIAKKDLFPALSTFLKETFNVFNKEYGIKKHLGQSVFGVERYFRLIGDSVSEVILPRGCQRELIDFLVAVGKKYEIVSQYAYNNPITFAGKISLRPEQELIASTVLQHTHGIIIAPPGSGKTVMALEIAKQLSVPTLVVVNRNQLLAQWVERIEQFLGVPKRQIGTLSGVRKKVGDKITVATIQTLARHKNILELASSFGLVIVDECHHIPAKTYRELLQIFQSQYLYGLTATHERKFGTEKITEYILGDVIAEMKQSDRTESAYFAVRSIPTQFSLPFRFTTDVYELLAKAICYDTGRNALVASAVHEELLVSQQVLVLTERKEHVELLRLYLGTENEIITITGDDSASLRAKKFAQIKAGNFRVLIATGQLLGEGIDMHGFDSLVLAFPFADTGKLTQYIGRLRGVGVKRITDFHDQKTPFLDRQFKKRRKYYDGIVLNATEEI